MKKVLVRDKCEACNGHGSITNAAWVDYWETLGENEYTDSQALEHFKSNGYEELPPVEGGCSECGGSGWTEGWMTMNKLFTELMKLKLTE